MKREECECDLQFAGFVVIACPLKSESKAAIKQIQESSHHVRIACKYRVKKKSDNSKSSRIVCFCLIVLDKRLKALKKGQELTMTRIDKKMILSFEVEC